MIARLNKATVLNSAVSRIYFALQGKFEVLERSAFPNKESISLRWILRGIDTDNSSILYAPVKWVTIPTLQGLPVEKGLFGKKRDR